MTNSNSWFKKENPLLGLSGMGGGAGGILVESPVTSSGYEISKSIKFNDGDTAYLKRTGGNGTKGGNRRTFTWSGWLKLGKLTAESFNIFNVSASPGNSASNVRRTEFKVASDHRLVFGVNSSGSAWKTLQTTAKFRDPSAWYHVVLAVDTNQPDADARVNLWVNGELQDVTGDYPVQYEQTPYNNQADCHALGTYINNLNDFYDGYMAEVYWIDGLQLSPACFGAFSTTYAWNPKSFSLPFFNDNTTWSSGTISYEHPSYNVARAFNGLLTGNEYWAPADGTANWNGFASFEPSNDIEFNHSLRFYMDFDTRPATDAEPYMTVWTDIGGEERVQAPQGGNVGPNSTNKKWYTIKEGKGKLEKITLHQGSLGYWARIYAIEVDGITLIDGKTDPKTRTNVNNGTAWDSLVTGSAHSGQGGDKAFDGDESTLSQATNGSNASLTFTPTTAITGQVEILIAAGAHGGTVTGEFDLKIGNVSKFNNSIWPNNTTKWVDLGEQTIDTTHGLKWGNSTGNNWHGIKMIKIDGVPMINETTDHSFHLKFDETDNSTELGHDAFVEDTAINYAGCETSMSQNDAAFAFNGSLTGQDYLGPNSGGIAKFDFGPLGGIDYSSKVEVYANLTNNGQYDMCRVNGGSWVQLTGGGNGDQYGWADVVTGTGNMRTFEIRDSTSNSVSGAAEGAFRALRVDGTILTGRSGNNWTPINIDPLESTLPQGTTVTITGFNAATGQANIHDGDMDTAANGHNGGVPGTVTFSPPIPNVTKVRLYSQPYKHYLNGTDVSSTAGTTNGDPGWYTVYDNSSTPINLTSCGNAYTNGTQSVDLRAIEINGVIQKWGHNGTGDSSTDTPTNYGKDSGKGGEVRGNYCTWNSLDAQDTGILTQGNLRYVNNGNSWKGIRGTFDIPDGKWYWEYTQVGADGASYGIASRETPLNDHVGGTGSTPAYTWGGANWYQNGSGTGTSLSAMVDGDVIGVAYDRTNGKLHFRRNGQWYGASWATKTASQVAAGTDPVTSSVSTSVQFFPTHSNYSSGRGCSVNFGQKPFIFAAPTGFKTLCAANLSDTFGDNDDTNDPNKYFDTRTWIGDSRSPRVVGIKGDFTPDLIWLKNRTTSGRSHYLYDVIRTFASRKELVPNSDVEEGSSGHLTQNHGYVSGVGIGSFTLGSGATNEDYTNKLENHYVAWNWDAGTAAATPSTEGSITPSGQWVNDTAGFSISKYTGTEAAATVGHGLSKAPEFVIVKNIGVASSNWLVWHKALAATEQLYLNDNSAVVTGQTNTWNSTKPTDDVISMNASWWSNDSGVDHIAYCWRSIAGYSAFGSWKGTGADPGPFVFLGFRPRYFLMKELDDATNWLIYDAERDSGNPTQFYLFANTTDAGATYDASSTDLSIDFLSNGVKIRNTNSGVNASGDTYIYAAFAEQPFKVARGG